MTSHAWTHCTAPFRPHYNHSEPIQWQLEIQKMSVLVTHATTLITSTLLHQTVTSSVALLIIFTGGRPALCSKIFLGSSSASPQGHFYFLRDFMQCSRWFPTQAGTSKGGPFPPGKPKQSCWRFCTPHAEQAQHSSLAPAKLWEFSSLQQSGRLTLRLKGLLCWYQLVTFPWKFPNSSSISIYTVTLIGTARSKLWENKHSVLWGNVGS